VARLLVDDKVVVEGTLSTSTLSSTIVVVEGTLSTSTLSSTIGYFVG